ncbi:response regulator [Massilia norwichensis]|uniref:histidine kinase n=1 Tax=Massilia norwichensis TaxID=1442366 RepID=A0ABT2AAV8_9BURK|nr:response regulator [Massilia norwichensis]MCS0591336.1 response regulator [Massilia norwichensis]
MPLPYVFDIFTQGVRTPDRSQGGLGIGLALVKSLVALHEGQVRAQSAGPGKGSVFEVELPLLVQSKAAEPDAGSQPASGAGKAARTKRILVVDDNVDAANSLGELLALLGHEVVVRFDGKSALRDAAAFAPDVLVLDIGLPDMDGYELARRLRSVAATAQARYLALTGYGQAHDRTLAHAAGFDHHFVKPVDIVTLQAVLDADG